MYDKAEEAQDAEREKYGPEADMIARTDGATLAEQAQAMREGRERWRPSWVDYGPAREVEMGVNFGEARKR
ncbi:hypothetical protein MMC06_000767 [Schaereria dolodes]|nr:hypothetical protein [Schaereria dolodes]